MGGKLTDEKRVPREQMVPLVAEIVYALADYVGQVEVAGSFRRQKETVADLEFVIAKPVGILHIMFDGFHKWCHANMLNIRGVDERVSGVYKNVQLDFEITPPDNFGAALLYFTGSKEFNIGMRARAKELGYKLNQRGLYVVDMYDDSSLVASETEEDIFEALSLAFIPPQQREFFPSAQKPQNSGCHQVVTATHTIPSATQSDKTYTVKVYDNGDYATCNCPDFQYRKRAMGIWCKHIKQVLGESHG